MFAIGHLHPYIHLSNKLAQKDHRISFLIPTKTQSKLRDFSISTQISPPLSPSVAAPGIFSRSGCSWEHPDHNVAPPLVPIIVPHVDGRPAGVETTSDVPLHLHPHIMTAMDRSESDIELLLRDLIRTFLGIRSILYSVVTPLITVHYFNMSLAGAWQHSGNNFTKVDPMQPQFGFPVSLPIKLHNHEAREFTALQAMKLGGDVIFSDRLSGLSQCDAIAFRTCREIEGPYIDNLGRHLGKPVFLSGPVITKPPTPTLDEKWFKWLGKFKAGSVIYYQFQELVLGLELSGRPFLAALKPPLGSEFIEEAWPEGFEERVQGIGVVHGGWVQQLLILEHPSVGCFITHCELGSLFEGLMSQCQLVILPQVVDQVFNARIMSKNLKVGVEIEKGEEDGLLTKESVCKEVRTVMEDDSEVGRDVRANHAKLRDLLSNEDLESSYIDGFCQNLQDLVG
ncbi:hypothetical protein ACJW30_06G119000 [Castanea mollissima]